MSYFKTNTLNNKDNNAYLTGRNGHKKTDRVKGMSDQTFNSRHNIQNNTSGGLEGYTALSRDSHINNNKLFHNNVGDNLLREQNFGFRIFVDSTFRNFKFYPDPFNFRVRLNSIQPTIEEVSLNIPITITNDNIDLIGCDRDFSYQKYIDGGNDITITISKQITNVFSFNLNTVIFPKSLNYKTNDDGTISSIGKKISELYKYIILSIDEIRTDTKYSNTGIIGKDTFILKYDEDQGLESTYWYPIEETVEFFESRKQNIESLTFSFRTDKGKPLCPTLDGKEFDFHQEYKKQIDNAILLNDKLLSQKPNKKKDIIETKKGKISLKEKCSDDYIETKEKLSKLTNKLISLREIVECLYPQVHFTLNKSRAQLDTLTDYRI
jgi:hypothetical protein